MELTPDFNESCELSIDRRVELVLVETYTLALHGAPR